jgi:hypothetical protein
LNHLEKHESDLDASDETAVYWPEEHRKRVAEEDLAQLEDCHYRFAAGEHRYAEEYGYAVGFDMVDEGMADLKRVHCRSVLSHLEALETVEAHLEWLVARMADLDMLGVGMGVDFDMEVDSGMEGMGFEFGMEVGSDTEVEPDIVEARSLTVGDTLQADAAGKVRLEEEIEYRPMAGYKVRWQVEVRCRVVDTVGIVEIRHSVGVSFWRAQAAEKSLQKSLVTGEVLALLQQASLHRFRPHLLALPLA